MNDYIKSNFIIEQKVIMQEIPAIIFRPKQVNKPIPTIIFYHGWSSSKESQRIRGFLLAAAGYQVIIPDAVYHGERNPLSDYSVDAGKEYFWNVILNNIEESNTILKDAVMKYNADPKRIVIMGSSMGGFTAAGIFTHNKDIKTLVVFNGSCCWENYNKKFNVHISEEIKLLVKKINEMDPMNNLDLLKNRPVLLLHGDSDTAVPIDGQRVFYNKIKLMYDDAERINLIEYPGLNHFITTNMMEESINWVGKYL